jgi:hypothetical protein
MLPGQLKPNTALLFLVKAVEIERKARGEPTEIVEQRTTDAVSDDNRAALEQCLQNDQFREWLADLASANPTPTAPVSSTNGTTNGAVPR